MRAIKLPAGGQALGYLPLATPVLFEGTAGRIRLS